MLYARFQRASINSITLLHIIFPNWKMSSAEQNSPILCLSVSSLYKPCSYEVGV